MTQNEQYIMPSCNLLTDYPVQVAVSQEYIANCKEEIAKVFSQYDIPIEQIEVSVGPTVSRYEIALAENIKFNNAISITEDLESSIETSGVRVFPIYDCHKIVVEMPNNNPQLVSLHSAIESKEFIESQYELPIVIGKTFNDRPVIKDLAKLPHLVVVGRTGHGKSVALNSIIASLLFKKKPEEIKFVFVDLTMVEFSLYETIANQFIAKLPGEQDAIITSPEKGLQTLSSISKEVNERYNLLRKAKARNIKEYSKKLYDGLLKPEYGFRELPYIVVVIDELADFIMTAGKDVTMQIALIAQKSRAVGIHLIIATQRPSVNIIDGKIKANFPARIAFRMDSRYESRIVIDDVGARNLIKGGDMLCRFNEELERVQGAYIDTPEIENLVNFIQEQKIVGNPYVLPEPDKIEITSQSKYEDLFEECARFVIESGCCSTPMLQRRFGIGYAHALRIVERLEKVGIISPADGYKPRTILINSTQFEEILMKLKNI